ncbi:MAG TPA: hypothetical protein VIK63_06515 [Haloplasmataceae bacterium]
MIILHPSDNQTRRVIGGFIHQGIYLLSSDKVPVRQKIIDDRA